MARVPYPRPEGLPAQAAEQIERDFMSLPEEVTIVFSSSPALVVGVFASRLYLPFSGTIVSVRANVNVAPASTATFDILKSGVSIFPTAAKPNVVAAAFVDSSFRVPDTRGFLTTDYLQVEVEATGGATGLVVCINVRRNP